MDNVNTNKQGAIDYLVDCIKTICEGYQAGELDVDGYELEDLAVMIHQIEEQVNDEGVVIFEHPMSASGLNWRIEDGR